MAVLFCKSNSSLEFEGLIVQAHLDAYTSTLGLCGRPKLIEFERSLERWESLKPREFFLRSTSSATFSTKVEINDTPYRHGILS